MSVKCWMIALGLIAIWGANASAHDIYTRLTDQRGNDCCDGTDCRPVHYRFKAGGVQMLIGKAWFYIAQNAIQYRSLEGDSGETNGGHWCGKHMSGANWESVTTYCAFLPPNLASLSSD